MTSCKRLRPFKITRYRRKLLEALSKLSFKDFQYIQDHGLARWHKFPAPPQPDSSVASGERMECQELRE